MTKMVVFLAVLAACGGKNKNDAEESGGPTIDTQATSGDPTDRSGSMVAPETMEEINALLGRKQMIVSRCLSQAVDAGEMPKGSRAKVTLAISISPSGQASKFDVIKSSNESQTVQGCVKKHVQEITFPAVPQQYDTSWTYAMEVN